MKNLDLVALSHLTLGEFSDFLKWMTQFPSGLVTTPQLRTGTPIRSSKSSAMLKVLEEFGFVQRNPDRVMITPAAREFVAANLTGRMGQLRNLFSSYYQIETVMQLLRSSANGRMKFRIVYFTLKENFEDLTDAEMRALTNWAHWCELIYFDKKRDELCLIEGRSPNRLKESGVRAVS